MKWNKIDGLMGTYEQTVYWIFFYFGIFAQWWATIFLKSYQTLLWFSSNEFQHRSKTISPYFLTKMFHKLILGWIPIESVDGIKTIIFRINSTIILHIFVKNYSKYSQLMYVQWLSFFVFPLFRFFCLLWFFCRCE